MSVAQSIRGTAFVQTLESGPKQVTIFGREPTIWMGIIESLLQAFTAFGLGTRWGITQDTYGIWVTLIAAIMGFIVAFLTKDTMLGVTIGLVKAVISLIAIYGLTLTDQQTGSVIALVPLIVLMWQRTQTAPIVAGEVIPRDAPPLPVTITPPEEYPPEAVTSEPPVTETPEP